MKSQDWRDSAMTNKRQGQATALKDEMARQSASSCLLLLLSATLVATVGAFLHLPSLLFAASGSTNELDVARRIERIENGLLPAITIKGQPLRKMNIADRMKYYNVPGVSIAFFDHGRITWTKTYGYANVAEQRPITAETLFQAGSISKPTTGLAVLRLVEEGRLDLDEDVNAKLSERKVPENEFTKEQKVTLRRLLSHTAGVNIHGFIGYPQGNPVPSLLQVLKGEKPANTPPVQVVMTPGTTWRYSGGGYTIVQLLLTELEHRP